jgi:hypothetical protein
MLHACRIGPHTQPEWNRHGIAAPNGGKWFAVQVIRVRERL